MIKLSDFIFRHLVEAHAIEHCFLVTGGGAMHLNDSIGHTPGLTYICNHHEQASAIAQEGYFRASGRMCVTNVTTGPGGTNAVTGVLGQWLDSIPALYISGQIKRETMLGTYPELPLRQLGDQEADIVSIVKPITKYAKTIVEPNDILYELDKAMDIALSGRPGPVWLDIPLDVQAAMIEESGLRPYVKVIGERLKVKGERQIDALLEKIGEAKSPVIYVGNGVRLAQREEAFVQLAERLNIPVVTAISGSDILWYDHRLCFGKPGICGDRIGNIMVQNSDLLIVMGTRLSLRQVSYAYKLLAPKAYKVMIDIDEAEMHKPTLTIDMAIHADLRDAIDMLLEKTEGKTYDFGQWCAWGREIEKAIPTLFDDNPDMPGYCNSYKFAHELFRQMEAGDVVVTGNGTAYTYNISAFDFAYAEGPVEPEPDKDPYRFEPTDPTTVDFTADVVSFRERNDYIEVTLSEMAHETYDWIELRMLSDTMDMPAGVYTIDSSYAAGTLTASKGYLGGTAGDDPSYVALGTVYAVLSGER